MCLSIHIGNSQNRHVISTCPERAHERAHAGTRIIPRFFPPMGTWAGNFSKTQLKLYSTLFPIPANHGKNKSVSLHTLFSTFYTPTRPKPRKPLYHKGSSMGTFHGQVKQARAHTPKNVPTHTPAHASPQKSRRNKHQPPAPRHRPPAPSNGIISPQKHRRNVTQARHKFRPGST
jgi:hypothetical protein